MNKTTDPTPADLTEHTTPTKCNICGKTHKAENLNAACEWIANHDCTPAEHTGHTPGPPEPSVYSWELAKVIEQRDELLEALKSLYRLTANSGAWKMKEVEQMPEFAKAAAAIAKAEGKPTLQ